MIITLGGDSLNKIVSLESKMPCICSFPFFQVNIFNQSSQCYRYDTSKDNE